MRTLQPIPERHWSALSRNATIPLGGANPGALSLVSRESVTGGQRANAGVSPRPHRAVCREVV